MRFAGAVGLVVAGCALFWRLLKFLYRSYWAANTPHQLDYGEGIVWQQMRMIIDGQGYAPLKPFPAIVFHYPPVYHLTTWVVASVTGMGDLVAGRTLSILSTLAAAALIGMIAGLITDGSRLTRWICGATACLVSLTCHPVAVWSAMMRVDMLAVALSLTGLCLVMLALRKPALIYLAAITFVGAVFTKQTMLAAPGAAFLVLLFARPALAVRGIFACLGLGLAALYGLSFVTHGEFIHHIFEYNINRFFASRLWEVVPVVRQHAFYLLAGTIGLELSVWKLLKKPVPEGLTDVRQSPRRDIWRPRLWIAIAYAIAATCFLVLVGKSGSSINYYVEWFFAVSVFIGVSVGPAIDTFFLQTEKKKAVAVTAWPLILVPFLIAAGSFQIPVIDKGDQIQTAAEEAQLATLVQRIRESEKPVISDNMVILQEAGKDVLLEPAIVAELTSMKVYDERPFLRMIRNKEFAFFVVEGGPGKLPPSRYSPAVAAAIYQNYPRVQSLRGLAVHLPAVSGPAD